MHDILYKAVVVARQEREPVGVFLNRCSSREEMAYSKRGEGTEEHRPVGGRPPRMFYRTIQVCSTCFMVYALIEGAWAELPRQKRRGVGEGVRHRRKEPKAPIV